MSKLAIIVLDGFSFSIMDSIFKANGMPYLKSLSDSGSNLQVQTDIPLTGSAWASIVSGKAPFDSGFNDSRSLNHNYKVCKRTLSTKTVWNYLNDYGKKVGLFNSPYVDPIEKVNGFIIAGKGGPSKNRDFTYPYNLKKRIFEVWGGKEKYKVDINKLNYRDNLVGLIEEVRKVNDNNSKLSKEFIDKFNPDTFIGFYTETDKLFHVVYDHLITLPVSNSEISKKLFTLCRSIDNNIKNIFSSFDENTNKIIISDHGFGELKYRFDLEQWLFDNRYLIFDRGNEEFSRKRESFLPMLNFFLPNNLINYIKRVTDSRSREKFGFKEVIAENSPPIIWKKTKAFAITGNGIYINDTRFKQPTVKTEKAYLSLRSKIVKQLSDLKLEDGSIAFPDIVVKKDKKSFGTDGIDIALNANIVSCKRPNYKVSSSTSNLYFSKTGNGDVGSHRREGIFISQGPSFAKNNSRKIFNHTDVFSLILQLNNSSKDMRKSEILSFLEKNKI